MVSLGVGEHIPELFMDPIMGCLVCQDHDYFVGQHKKSLGHDQDSNAIFYGRVYT